jgi:hypothetical protein
VCRRSSCCWPSARRLDPPHLICPLSTDRGRPGRTRHRRRRRVGCGAQPGRPLRSAGIGWTGGPRSLGQPGGRSLDSTRFPHSRRTEARSGIGPAAASGREDLCLRGDPDWRLPGQSGRKGRKRYLGGPRTSRQRQVFRLPGTVIHLAPAVGLEYQRPTALRSLEPECRSRRKRGLRMRACPVPDHSTQP